MEMSTPLDLPEKIKLDLPNRGKCTAAYIDLYDEGQYGAGQVAWRGRWDSTTFEGLGGDIENIIHSVGPNPDEQENNVLSYNRLHDPFVHYWAYPEAGDPYPCKSRYMLHLRMKIKFNKDTAIIGFGKKWEKYRNDDGTLNEKYPYGDIVDGDDITLAKMEILYICGISYDDAATILNLLGANIALSTDDNTSITDEAIVAAVKAGTITDRQLKTVIATLSQNEELISVKDDLLHTDGTLLTVTD